MKLRDIIKNCDLCFYTGNKNPEISMVSSDSRNVRNGALFIAVEGYSESGLRYIDDAVRRGAKAVIVEDRFRDRVKIKEDIPLCFTPNARKCILLISRAFFRNPSKDFTLIGVTGTNGKTTVTYLIECILRENGGNPGIIGTISYRFNNIVKKASNTTPDPVVIQSLFGEMKRGGVSHVIVEVSSHALIMDRVLPQDFNIGVFTNLSQDHLDFHGTMEEYFKAKAILFKGLTEDSSAVINSDDEYGRKLIPIIRGRVVTYGMSTPSNYFGSTSSLTINGTTFTVNGTTFKTHLIGIHNLYNILSAYSVANLLGIDDRTIARALSKIKGIPGRFERAVYGKDYHLFVDYAHTPDALSHLLDAANSLKKGRIITVFGCGGDRDRGKRPIMGRVVEEKSDIAIVTSDNPRTEDPDLIIEDIKKGLTRDNHIIIPDRRMAIFKALELVQKDDIVLIAGKGHEDYQILKDRTIHFDDREVALEAVKSLGK